MNGGTLTATLSGDEADILGNKHDAFGTDNFGPSTPASYTFSI